MPDALFEGLQLFLANFWIVPIGVLIGMFVGGMPGLTSSGTLAMLLPVLLVLPPQLGLLLGVSLYAGAEMGNSFPSVMLNIPGTAGGAVTAFDGFPLMKEGRAAWALGICIMASVVGALIGGAASLTLSPQIAAVALRFGPAEICIVILFGLAVIAQLSSGGLAKGLFVGLFGLLLATTGTDPTFGTHRGTFGIVYLFDRLPVIAVLVGLLGFSEVLVYVEKGLSRLLRPGDEQVEHHIGLAGIVSGLKETFKYPWELLRGGAIGVGIGAMPGAGASVATFVSYQQAVAFAKPERKQMFGKGAPEGLIAADVTNNAVVGGALVPLLTLGIPGSGSMAVLLVVMTYHGMYVGPRLFQFSGDIAYAVLLSQFFAAGFILVIGTILAFFAYRVAYLNLKMMVPIISVFCLMGGFARNNFLFDMGVMVVFGCLGYVMKKFNYPVVAMLLGVILGRLFEREFMRAWRIGLDSPELFFTSTIAQILWVLFVFTFVGPPLLRYLRRKMRSGSAAE
ncbi:MAG: tripartite tricarboxylate transporter permease [Alphaproteobacteria bacterium]|nr:tripartite tricarboxylate transporter permease [Alphaproteobacteria bacterium]